MTDDVTRRAVEALVAALNDSGIYEIAPAVADDATQLLDYLVAAGLVVVDAKEWHRAEAVRKRVIELYVSAYPYDPCDDPTCGECAHGELVGKALATP